MFMLLSLVLTESDIDAFYWVVQVSRNDGRALDKVSLGALPAVAERWCFVVLDSKIQWFDIGLLYRKWPPHWPQILCVVMGL